LQNEGLDDEDRDAYTSELEEEDDLLRCFSDCLGLFLKFHGEAYMPLFDKSVAPLYAPYFSPQQPASLQIAAVCMLDDVIEFGGVSAHKYISHSLHNFMRNLASPDPVLRQCSSYGIAQVARVAPEFLLSEVNGVVKLLLALATSPSSSEEDNVGTTDNALLGLAYICRSVQLRQGLESGLLQQGLSVWLQQMPLRADPQQSWLSSLLLCDLIESCDKYLFGENNTNIPRIMRVLYEILKSGQTEDGLFCDGRNGINVVTNLQYAHQKSVLEFGDFLGHPDTLVRVQKLGHQILAGLPEASRNVALGEVEEGKGTLFGF